jgi:hypothetical protein
MATAEASSASGAGAAYEEERRKRILDNLKHLEVGSLARKHPRTSQPARINPLPSLPFPLLPFLTSRSRCAKDESFRDDPHCRFVSGFFSVASDFFFFKKLISSPLPLFPQDLGISKMAKGLIQATRQQDKVRASQQLRFQSGRCFSEARASTCAVAVG